MKFNLPIRIILIKPPAGVDYGIQLGSGLVYETILKQRGEAKDLIFEFDISVKLSENATPNFIGSIVQGPPTGRFIYVDIGTAAGQQNTCWSRRLKVPLINVSADTINSIINNPTKLLEASVAGTAKDGGPNCGTVKPFDGWSLKDR